jgi:gliding motility-associated lipoprotein GldH
MMNTLKNHVFLFWILFAGVAVSCNHNTFYHKTIILPNETWNVDSTLVYEFTITDSLQFYNFYLDVRNTTSYPKQNFWIFFTTQFPDGSKFTDTLNCILSDAYGRWNGKGSGRVKDNRFLFKPKVRFQQKGDYIFSVQQAMRTVDLKGITDFGITLQYE